jgi:pimeloyl-ACP methyl ester carboxylesterase
VLEGYHSQRYDVKHYFAWNAILRVYPLVGPENYITGLSIQRIPDSSHRVIHEQPARINKLIREYIGSKH